MLPAERQARILEYLRAARFASLQAIARKVDASLSTVRRDVDTLTEQGHLRRSHGGAEIREDERLQLEAGPELSQEIARAEKWRIAHRAAQEVVAGQSVLLDSGSTTMAVADALLQRQIPLTVFTNDLTTATRLGRSSLIEVNTPPGRVRTGSATLLGSACFRMFSELRVALAFVGAHAVCLDGASEATIEYAEIKRVMLDAAERRVLVADSSKFYGRARRLFAALTDFDTLITDDGLDVARQKELRAHGAAVEIAS